MLTSATRACRRPDMHSDALRESSLTGSAVDDITPYCKFSAEDSSKAREKQVRACEALWLTGFVGCPAAHCRRRQISTDRSSGAKAKKKYNRTSKWTIGATHLDRGQTVTVPVNKPSSAGWRGKQGLEALLSDNCNESTASSCF